jgi:prepilin-type N-terminal cleavage/methylation domain-containing protein
MMMTSRGQRLPGRKAISPGFSLLELLVAMAVFLLISAVSFTLFSRHQALLSQEQVTVGLNIGLRNALAQIQIDVVNSGNGLILGQNVPAWPVGVTIQNSDPTAAQCDPQASSPPVYAAACFDSMSVILADRTTPALVPQTATGGTGTISTSAGTTFFAANPVNPATGQPFYTPAQLAARFNTGDKILFVKGCSGGFHRANLNAANSSGCAFTTAVLSAPGAVATTNPPGPTFVMLTFNSTLAGGANPVCLNPNTCNDPLNMTSYTPAGDLADSYGTSDYVVRLAPISYWVDTTNPLDPQLKRTQAGTDNVLMDQVIGFKVGAALWNSANTSTFQYNYDASTYPIPYDYSLIRSVRVSMIGRTQPNPSDPYRNPFDQGPYQIRGNSIIVDPRNLTMNGD